MYPESQLLSISGLQHLMFCPRQWALIHLEQTWSENYLTALGRVLHNNAHKGDDEQRGNLRITRGLRLRSLKYGIVGQSDVVEFHREHQHQSTTTSIAAVEGFWRPVPVEYKRGKPKKDKCDEVQLCAQALCLEEMLEVQIEYGFLFYGLPRRRSKIVINEGLRQLTTDLIDRMRQMFDEGNTPKAEYGKKCKSCSMLATCMPSVTGVQKNVSLYIRRGVKDETIT